MAIFAMFPGQGSQHVGMGKDLYENFAEARAVFEEVSDSVSKDIKKLCFQGPETELVLTENTQPCLLAVSVAAFRVAVKETGLTPAAVAGHSLGEYSALVAAGFLPLSITAYWVAERGKAMQSAVPVGQGGMAAIIKLGDDKINMLCKKATDRARLKRSGRPDLVVETCVEPANFNTPGQTVIAGSYDALEEAISMVKLDSDYADGKAIPLSVSAPFHCRLMKPACDRMAELFKRASPESRPRPSAIPYYPNRTGRLSREPGTVFEFLIEQVDHPVLWRHTLLAAIDAGYTQAIEFGPGKALVGMAKRAAEGAGKPMLLANVSDTTTLKALKGAL
jgi:[acyl-carrier-protein] S-malonyltransferase